MSDSPAPIRSYQRIFTPDRRIYQIDGRRRPVPGGVPLEWLAWAFAGLVMVLVLGQRSILFAATVGAGRRAAGRRLAGLVRRRAAGRRGVCGDVGCRCAGGVA